MTEWPLGTLRKDIQKTVGNEWDAYTRRELMVRWRRMEEFYHKMNYG
jgi:hypothetical protein